MIPIVCIIVCLLLARMIIFQPSNIINDSLLLVQESHSITLFCRASGTPLWYDAAKQLVSMANSKQVYQATVNTTTQRLHINSYVNSLSGEYSCRSSTGLNRSIILTTGTKRLPEVIH